MSRTKEDQSKLSKAHYYSNLEYYRRKRKESRERRQKIVREAKEKPCADCGIQYGYWVMQFDHIRDKLFTIAGNWTNVSLSSLVEEIAKCEIVCANCHANRTYRRAAE